MKPRLVAIAPVGLLASTLSTGAFADAPFGTSIHQRELERHAILPLPAERKLPPLVPLESKPLKRVVYGYLPYWTNDLSTIRWSALTHVAWFSVGINQDGSVGVKHNWPDTQAVEVAHAQGVKVDLAFTLFNNAAITALCNSPAARALAVKNMVDQMEAGGADGISVDFEFVASPGKAGFVKLIEELRAELDARGHGEAEISMAGPTVDWNDGLDMVGLMATLDWFFVMGYDYFWSGSAYAGPSGILRVSDDWLGKTTLSSTRTLAEYTAKIAPADRKKLIWGVPYYGREWTTTSGDIAAQTVESIGSVTYSSAMKDLSGGLVEAFWNDGAKTPWYRWQEGAVWHQVYFDDEQSLAAKYELALAQEVGGVGMWALNYDVPHGELWDLIESTFSIEPTPALGHRANPVIVDAFPFEDARSTVDGPSHYFNFYSCKADAPEYGREWVYQVDVCQPGTLSASVPSYGDRDPDLHILDAVEQEACLTRDDTDVAYDVKPGRYFVVVDSYVAKGVAREGDYTLTVDFVPDAGSKPCAAHLTCDAGSCVCPGDGLIDCDGLCIDPKSDLDHCGACGNACAAFQSCVDGACVGDDPTPEEPVEPPPPDAVDGIVGANPSGCECGVRVPSASPRAGLVALSLAAIAARRRKRLKAR